MTLPHRWTEHNDMVTVTEMATVPDGYPILATDDTGKHWTLDRKRALSTEIKEFTGFTLRLHTFRREDING